MDEPQSVDSVPPQCELFICEPCEGEEPPCCHPTYELAKLCLESRGKWWTIIESGDGELVMFTHPTILRVTVASGTLEVPEIPVSVRQEDTAWLASAAHLLGRTNPPTEE